MQPQHTHGAHVYAERNVTEPNAKQRKRASANTQVHTNAGMPVGAQRQSGRKAPLDKTAKKTRWQACQQNEIYSCPTV